MDSQQQTDQGLSRREAMLSAARVAGGVGAVALGLTALTKSAPALPVSAIRPPGALAEDGGFLSACVRCGLCVRDCPYGTLSLASLGDGPATGTPYFEARKIPCEMCQDIPCVVACPTGALSKDLTDITKARMGIAVLVGQETCLNYLGLRCDVCYRVCPLIDEAITLEMLHNPRTGKHALFIPTVHSAQCTGCGKCEASCVLEEAAIKVLPERVALGRMGDHYRLGWEEKRKAGKSLIDGIIDLPDRGMEGPALPVPTEGGGYKGFKP